MRKPFAITYKNSRRARNVQTIACRFSESLADAIADAAQVVDEITYGEGVVISVQPTADPR